MAMAKGRTGIKATDPTIAQAAAVTTVTGVAAAWNSTSLFLSSAFVSLRIHYLLSRSAVSLVLYALKLKPLINILTITPNAGTHGE